MKNILTIVLICGLADYTFAQNFGIDQPSPTEKLDVNGNIKATGTISAGGNMRISTSGDAKYEYFGSSSDRGFVGWQISTAPVGVHVMNRDNTPIILSTTNAERMRIDAAGNVGIGTVSPLRNLEVNNAMRFTNSSADVNDGVIGTAPFSAGLNVVGINTDGGGRKVSWWGSFLQQENPVGNTFTGTSTFTGQIKIQGGSPAAGRVLTSDASGLATWAIPGVTGRTSEIWSAKRTGGVNSTAWTTIPGLSITFNLNSSAKIQIVANGEQRTNGQGSGDLCHQAYRKVVDGTVYGNPDHGERLFVTRGDVAWWGIWTYASSASLPAGSHTISIQTRASGGANCWICYESGGGLQGYTDCDLIITAVYD